MEMKTSHSAPRRILIVEDSADDRELVRRSLPREFATSEASNEAEAAALFSTQDFYLAFVDVFLDSQNQRAYGIKVGARIAERIPVIYMSDKEDRTQRALINARVKGLRFLDKNRDFLDRDAVAKTIQEACDAYYSGLAIEFPGSESSWGSVARFLEPVPDLRQDDELELELLVRAATHGWDESTTDAVSATRFELQPLGSSGGNTVVLQMRPYSITNEAGSDHVLRLSRNRDLSERIDFDGEQGSKGSKYLRFRNLVGGYGLPERSNAERCHFNCKIYSVPYFRLDQTQTYSEYFRRESGDDEGLRRLDSITVYLFDQALGPLNGRLLSGDENLSLRDYYAKRIKSDRRLAAIMSDLLPQRRPASIRVSETGMVIPINGGVRQFRNPSIPVLESGEYSLAHERVSSQLRHGDFHPGNVLVDSKRLCCWYMDYESMDEHHFLLVDHVEFEADVIFSIMSLDDNYEFFGAFIDAITGSTLVDIEDVSGLLVNDRQAAEARKALTVIRSIRNCVRRHFGTGDARTYYHALMFEALRVAGISSIKRDTRWRALLASAVIFDKLESKSADTA